MAVRRLIDEGGLCAALFFFSRLDLKVDQNLAAPKRSEAIALG